MSLFATDNNKICMNVSFFSKQLTSFHTSYFLLLMKVHWFNFPDVRGGSDRFLNASDGAFVQTDGNNDTHDEQQPDEDKQEKPVVDVDAHHVDCVTAHF